MATRETREQRGRRHADQILRRVEYELHTARVAAGLSQQAAAQAAGWSQTEISRFERGHFPTVGVKRLSQLASVVGMELAVTIHPSGEPVRDRGHQAAIERFAACISPAYSRTREVPLPNPGDRRSWDLLLRLETLLIGVEVETRIRDVQALVRRIRERERDGGVDHILVVLADTAHNRALVGELRETLGVRFATSPRLILAALRSGMRVSGSGVVLV